MTLLALTITKHSGLRLAEVGELLGFLGGVALVVGGLMPFRKGMWQTVGGAGIALGFLLLVIATHSAHFGSH